MDVQSVIQQAGGIDAVAKQLGISPKQAQAGVSALMPAVLGGFKKNAKSNPAGIEGMVGMLGQMGGSGLFDNVVSSEPTDIGTGNQILGNIFGSKDVSRQVATQASAQSGLDSSVLKQMLPIVAMMVAGYLANRGGAQSPQQGGLGGILGSVLGGQQQGGGLGDVLGSVLGGQQPQRGAPQQSPLGGLGQILDMDGDGNPLDDIIGLAGKLSR
jgi:hypothetical protein